jgi:membrane associated rhomboid family serine protease
MNKAKIMLLKSYMRRMNYCFIASIGGLIIYYFFNDALPSLALLGILGAVVAILGFYIYLGDLAGLLGKSPIIWMGVSFITSPVGPFVAYIAMYVNAHDEIQALSDADE